MSRVSLSTDVLNGVLGILNELPFGKVSKIISVIQSDCVPIVETNSQAEPEEKHVD